MKLVSYSVASSIIMFFLLLMMMTRSNNKQRAFSMLCRRHRRRCAINKMFLTCTLILLVIILQISETMTCFALFQTTSQSLSVSMRGPRHVALHRTPLFRQNQVRHQRSNRIESLELHALFRPDGDSNKRTPLLRTSANRSDNDKGNGGKSGIKITGGSQKHIPSTSTSTMDKMRLDLMRSDLSIKISEDRVKRLENELREMTKKYNWAQSALRERASTNGGRLLSTTMKGQDQSSQVQPQQRQQKQNKQPSPLQPKTKSVPGKTLIQNELHTTILQKGGGRKSYVGGQSKKNSSSSNNLRPTTITKSSFQGNTIDDLPPFAAGLFANAEREEKQRRLKLGIIEEAELDDLSSSSLVTPTRSFPSPSPLSPSSLPSSIELLSPMAAGLFEQAERVEMEKRARRGVIEESELLLPSLPNGLDGDIPAVMNISNTKEMTDKTVYVTSGITSVEDGTNYTTTEDAKLKSPALGYTTVVDKSTGMFDKIKSIDTNAAVRGDISITDDTEKELLSLRKQCAILSHKLSRSEELRRAQTDELRTSLKSEKILRGLNSDWTRRMSDARREMDEEKAEWNKDYEEKKKCWEAEKNVLEEKLKLLECEKEGLQLRLENQNNITFVATLFSELLKERVSCKLLHTKNRLFPGHTNASFGQNETQTFVFSSPNLTWRRLRYGKKAPNRMLTVGGATEQRASRALRLFTWAWTIGNKGVNTNSVHHEETGRPALSSNVSTPPGLEPLAPLLVTKKRRLPKLHSEKKSTWKSPSLVPKFLRKVK